MWLKSALLICCAVASTLGDERIATKLRPGQTYSNIQTANIEAVTFRDRSIPIEEYVSSRKAHVPVSKYGNDEEEEDEYYGEEEEEEIKIEKMPNKKVPERIENLEKKQSSFKDNDRIHSKKQTRVELENFSDTGVLHEDGIKKVDLHRTQIERQRDSVIPGVYVSNEYPTTMLPTLTTPREVRSFDFIPVNIIREDSKDAYTPYADRQFGDLSDVSLVPAGTNSRIQVKKGPNGKDYEYEYVYYYYDEDDEGKASSVSNTHDVPNRTTPSPRRAASNGNRSKYTNVDRSTTVEPVSNEVIPNRNRGRQLAEADEITEERLPTNTRFPPRSRSNHNTGTTESSRVRGNRPRPSLELVDSSSFRTHQEGPEFPQNLPKGPVRFIGVTPNEDNEEKPSSKNRGRPHRVQEPASVEETVEDPQPIFRRRPVSNADPESQVELNRGQPPRPLLNEDDDEGSTAPEAPHHISGEKKLHSAEKQDTEPSDFTTTTDSPTTEYPSAMDKVALDLYAFLQQGQNNLVDATAEADSSSDSTTQSDEDTTELITTTESGSTTVITTESTTSTTEPSTTSTTPEPTTSATTTTTGRGKFRRPGVPGGAISRNRFKLNGSTTSTTESTSASVEPTQKVRGRFGGNGNSGFKRPRPGPKQPVDEEIHKESSASVNAEKPNGTRNRFRGTGTRNVAATTPGPSSTSSSAGNSATNSAVSRPTFNKLNINRRRGRPSTAAPTANEEPSEGSEPDAHDATTTPKTSPRPRIPGVAPRPVRPGARVNLRLNRPGQTTSTTLTPEASEVPVDEPASEGTEEETHEAPAESSPPNRLTTANPLNKLRNRNRLQVQPKTTTRLPVSTTPRRSPLLPRRKTTETPVEESVHEQENEEETVAETEPTESSVGESSTAASTKHEEVRGLSGLLAPRRRIAPRRPGQIISRE